MKNKFNNLLIILLTFTIIFETILLIQNGFTKLALLIVLTLIIIIIIIALLFHDELDEYRFKNKFNSISSKKALVAMDLSNYKIACSIFGTNECEKVLDRVLTIINNSINGFSLRQYEDHYVFCILYETKKEVIDSIKNIYESIEQIEFEKDFILGSVFGVYYCNDDEYKECETRSTMAWKDAKKSNNTYYSIYDINKVSENIKTKQIFDELVQAIKNNSFEVYYQPKFDTNTKEISGSEALIRIIKNGKVLNAKTFIDVAEASGFITTIDKYVFEEVCKKIKFMKEREIDFKEISINVSRETLCSPNMIEIYQKTMKKYDVNKEDIELEITERTSNNVSEEFFDMIDKLTKEFNVSIDDFGTGYSSLSMLSDKLVKTIKIDKKFIDDNSKEGKEIIKFIVDISSSLGFNTICEGVETEEQYLFLKKIGCKNIQGYYFSKPLNFDAYYEMIKRK